MRGIFIYIQSVLKVHIRAFSRLITTSFSNIRTKTHTYRQTHSIR